MTAPQLPDFNGEPVTSTSIKFTGVGTGFTGLEVRPIVMEMDDVAFFVVKVKAAESASHLRDKNGHLVRLQRVRAEDMAPISEEVAQEALAAYAREIEGAKASADGQDGLFDPAAGFQGRTGIGNAPSAAEVAAADAEALDEVGSPGEVAQAAADRVNGGNVVAFTAPPAGDDD